MTYDAKAYGAAYDAHSAAFKIFDAARVKYRNQPAGAGKAGDAEFLAAKAAYAKATAAYDEAFNIAAFGGYLGPKA